jgi:hypothetical protein
MPVKWWEWWKVLPDDERQQWTLDPFASVGLLRFDASPGEVSQALGTVTGDSQVDTHGRDVGQQPKTRQVPPTSLGDSPSRSGAYSAGRRRWLPGRVYGRYTAGIPADHCREQAKMSSATWDVECS